MKIGLIPLDERPANTRYPAMIAAIAGAELLLPPRQLLSDRRRPADCAALSQWLESVAPGLDGLIVSLEQLGYGGLIASRISAEPAAAVTARLDTLRLLRAAQTRLPIFAFAVITRVSNANDAVEEPAYWAEYGERLYLLSQLLDRRRGAGQPVEAALGRLEAELPADQRRDFLARRLRNHAVNLAALHMLGEGSFDLLVLSSDDTSPCGLPARERRSIAGWAELVDAGGRLLMYPGADEVGCALLARMLNGRAGHAPTVAVSYAPAAAAEHVAAYEDGPVRLTVERQIAAVGGRPAGADADIWLGVNAPVARRAEWAPAHAESERAERLPDLDALASAARRRLASGQTVALADVAYPNGADPALIDLLLDGGDLAQLAAYGAWNTAGNTIGTALAQACAARLSDTPAGRAAQQRFLLHRFVEDWGYQHVLRAEARAWLQASCGTAEPATPAALADTTARIEAGLSAIIARLPGFAQHYQIVPGSVRLPWGRTFEVDFELSETRKGVVETHLDRDQRPTPNLRRVSIAGRSSFVIRRMKLS